MKNTIGLASICLALTACGDIAPKSELTSQGLPPAIEIEFGSYTLHQNSKGGDGSCDVVVDLDIVNGETGGSVKMRSGLVGACEIYIAPNPREYTLTSVRQDACGSKIFTGNYVNSWGETEILELTDHRPRVCRDLQRYMLIATEKSSNGVEFQSWYHVVPRFLSPGKGGYTCMAHWSGYEIGSDNICHALGRSGCSNPFKFTTREACESFYRI